MSRSAAASQALALSVSLGMVRRGDPAALYSDGGCEWSATANRDTSNNRLIKNYPKEAGMVCLQSAQPDVFEATSAQEGGALILDRGKDRDTLMLYLDDSLILVKRANRGRQLVHEVRLGRPRVHAAPDRYEGLRRGRGSGDRAGTRRCATIALIEQR